MTLAGAVASTGNPNNWPTTPLRSFLHQVSKTTRSELPLLGVSLHSGVTKRQVNDGRPAASEDLSSYKVVRPGDVIMNRLGKPHGSVGTSPWHGITSPAYWVMEVDPRFAEPAFVHFLLRSRHLVAEYSRLGKNQPPNQFDISWDSFRKIRVPLPHREEQRRIAGFLDAETARIDRLVGLRSLQEKALAEKSYASLSEVLVPGSLTDPLGIWPWTWLPTAANDRPLVRVGYVCRLQNGLTVDSKRDVSGDVVTRPYLRVANVQAGSVALDSVTEITVPRHVADRSTLRSGDVLMTEGGDLDKLGRGTVWQGELADCLHQNHVFALRPEADRLDGSYLALMTRTLHGRCYFESTGTKTTNLASTNSSKILSFPIPLPSLAVQRNLTQQAQKVLAAVETMSQRLNRHRDLLSERRQALITAAVTGQFDVSTASGRNVTDGVHV